MRRWLTRALAAAVIVAAAGLGGFFAYGWISRPAAPAALRPQVPLSMRGAARSEAAVSASGGRALAGASPARPAADSLPDIAFEDQAGMMRRLSDWRGQPLLVNFWATWCAPCRAEIPLLERLSQERVQDGLQVVGVAVDSRTAVLDYARREGIQYPLLIGEQPGLELIRALGMQAVFPFSVFVDARGRIVTVKIGGLRADQVRLILDRIDKLDRGRIDLSTARSEIADGIAKLAVARAQALLHPKL